MAKNKIWDNFDDAVADILDGATIMMFAWSGATTGAPQNLIRALRDHEVKDLTIICQNFVPGRLPEIVSPIVLVDQMKKLITAWSGPLWGMDSPLAKAVQEGRIELEITSHGTLQERVRAGGSGIGAFYSPVGVGTIIEKGKEKRVIDGKEYLLEMPLRGDYSFVRAHKADKLGNLIYRGSGRGGNPIIAMASRVTIAEVDEIVEVGELDPESIVTPGIFVHRVVKIPEGGFGSYQQRPEQLRRIFEEGRVAKTVRYSKEG